MKRVLVAAWALVWMLGGGATAMAEGFTSPYAGQEKRAIKSFYPKDIDDLSNGRGWGLAKPAELNGLPGPAHILPMANEINLSADQRRRLEKLFAGMKAKAIPLGRRMIKLEGQLDQMFAAKTISREALDKHLRKIGEVWSELRLVHLETHLLTPKILTPHQVARYNSLRGYSKGDAGGHGGGHGGHQ
ncbi:MAG: hypothetical protein QGF09_15850 [Rhodospirillales bacterium]|nr:hypothetical protein [Rhodospirillales bacterium]